MRCGVAGSLSISSQGDEDMERDGDFTPKDRRYERAAEYLDVMRRVWTCTEPFDYDGRFYKLRKALARTRTANRKPGSVGEEYADTTTPHRRLVLTVLGCRAGLRAILPAPCDFL